MKPYHKINGLFKRDEKGKFTEEYSTPEFEYLKDTIWVGTEKIDGTNIRLHWNGAKVMIGGRTNNASIPTFLYDKLEEIIAKTPFKEYFSETRTTVTLYGEGYGRKIQKVGSSYINDGVDFILFDVKIGDWWLTRDGVNEVADALGLKAVETVFEGTLAEGIEMVKQGFKSKIGTADSEGLVLVPKVDLFARNGDRIITKLKVKDFR